MYILFSDLQSTQAQTPDNEAIAFIDVFFDGVSFDITHLVFEESGLFRKRKFIVPPEEVALIDYAGRILKISHKAASYKTLERHEPILSAADFPSRGSDYMGSVAPEDWRSKPGWLAKEMSDVIEHHRRYRIRSTQILSANSLLGFSFESTSRSLGQVSDYIFESKDWKLPYIIIKEEELGDFFLCPYFLIHQVEIEEKVVLTGIGSEAFTTAPKFTGLSDSPLIKDIDEDKLSQHYLYYYGKELRHSTGASDDTRSSPLS